MTKNAGPKLVFISRIQCIDNSSIQDSKLWTRMDIIKKTFCHILTPDLGTCVESSNSRRGKQKIEGCSGGFPRGVSGYWRRWSGHWGLKEGEVGGMNSIRWRGCITPASYLTLWIFNFNCLIRLKFWTSNLKNRTTLSAT